MAGLARRPRDYRPIRCVRCNPRWSLATGLTKTTTRGNSAGSELRVSEVKGRRREIPKRPSADTAMALHEEIPSTTECPD